VFICLTAKHRKPEKGKVDYNTQHFSKMRCCERYPVDSETQSDASTTMTDLALPSSESTGADAAPTSWSHVQFETSAVSGVH
jgi:hypothetical protein